MFLTVRKVSFDVLGSPVLIVTVGICTPGKKYTGEQKLHMYP